ncbi:MAG: hypothetical protein ACFFE3_02220, partial [Candidatus Thorarchaeota archaeon]
MTRDKEKSGTTSLDELFGDFAELVLENVTLEIDELKLALRPAVQQMARAATQQALALPKSLISSSFATPLGE